MMVKTRHRIADKWGGESKAMLLPMVGVAPIPVRGIKRSRRGMSGDHLYDTEYLDDTSKTRGDRAVMIPRGSPITRIRIRAVPKRLRLNDSKTSKIELSPDRTDHRKHVLYHSGEPKRNCRISSRRIILI
jgi:hypothetical protein